MNTFYLRFHLPFYFNILNHDSTKNNLSTQNEVNLNQNDWNLYIICTTLYSTNHHYCCFVKQLCRYSSGINWFSFQTNNFCFDSASLYLTSNIRYIDLDFR